MRSYLAGLRLPMIILWCYFCWYIAVMWMYFEPDMQVWLTSIGISLIIGLAYNLNVMTASPVQKSVNPWVAFRFFLMPLCVSSFSGLVKGKGFFMIFPPNLRENGYGAGLCLFFLLIVWLCKRSAKMSAVLSG